MKARWARRLMAFKHLGRATIPVTIISMAKLASGEYAENTFRDAFTPSEIVAITRTLEAFKRVAAKERQESGPNQYSEPCENFPQGINGKTRDKLAQLAGGDKSGDALEKASALVAAAEAEPEKFGKLPVRS